MPWGFLCSAVREGGSQPAARGLCAAFPPQLRRSFPSGALAAERGQPPNLVQLHLQARWEGGKSHESPAWREQGEHGRILVRVLRETVVT